MTDDVKVLLHDLQAHGATATYLQQFAYGRFPRDRFYMPEQHGLLLRKGRFGNTIKAPRSSISNAKISFTIPLSIVTNLLYLQKMNGFLTRYRRQKTE